MDDSMAGGDSSYSIWPISIFDEIEWQNLILTK